MPIRVCLRVTSPVPGDQARQTRDMGWVPYLARVHGQKEELTQLKHEQKGYLPLSVLNLGHSITYSFVHTTTAVLLLYVTFTGSQSYILCGGYLSPVQNEAWRRREGYSI